MDNLSPPIVSLGYGRYRIARKPNGMRVPDEVLKSVGFVAEVTHVSSAGDDYELCGTGFFVSIPSGETGRFVCFVTARHVVEGLLNRKFCILVNRKGGGTMVLPIFDDKGFPNLDTKAWFHPSDKTADVVVIPYNIDPECDVVSVPIEMFINREELQPRKIGIGDEIFITGLFTHVPAYNQNMPILRHGNIAMIPSEQIETADGYADVYLIEARSIGGLSGSPIFVRETLTLPANRITGEPLRLHGLGDTYLLGLIHGHWDIHESDMNKAIPTHDPRHGVNMGIAIVVPADKIIETINRPELRALRDKREAEIRQSRMPKPDTDNN